MRIVLGGKAASKFAIEMCEWRFWRQARRGNPFAMEGKRGSVATKFPRGCSSEHDLRPDNELEISRRVRASPKRASELELSCAIHIYIPASSI